MNSRYKRPSDHFGYKGLVVVCSLCESHDPTRSDSRVIGSMNVVNMYCRL
jgi:hypothetical protein